jgi:hypothetical protein
VSASVLWFTKRKQDKKGDEENLGLAVEKR